MFLAGAVVGSLVTAAGVVAWDVMKATGAVPGGGGAGPSRPARTGTSREPLVPADAALTEEQRWDALWPTLTFPARTPGEPARAAAVYDQAKDQTIVQTAFPVDAGHGLAFSATTPGKVEVMPRPPMSVTVALTRPAPSADERPRAEELAFIADAASVVLTHVESSAEAATFRLATPDLLTVADARTLRCRAGGVELPLSDDNVAAIRAFAALLKP